MRLGGNKAKRRGAINIILCPRCHSKSIRRFDSLSGLITPALYLCEECGYVGPIVLEVQIEDEEAIKSLHNTEASGQS